MKKIARTLLFVITAVMFCFAVSSVASAAEKPLGAKGSCGDNVTYTYNSTTKALVISGKGPMYDYTGKSAGTPFEDTDIKTVVIKKGVTFISQCAFSDCEDLEKVTLPNTLTSIGSSAFSGCSSLKNIVIPKNVTSIGDSSFSGCTLLKSIVIPESVTDIGSEAFKKCTLLKSITLPTDLEYIGYAAFEDTAYYNKASNWKNDALYMDKYLIEVDDDFSGIFKVKAGTRCIAGGAFFECEGLKGVTIPDSVVSIGEDAFRGCTGLTKIIVPKSVASIGNRAFFNCSALKNIVIPDSVTKLGSNVFCDTAYYNNESNWQKGVLYIGNHLIEAKYTLSGKYTIKAGTKSI